MNGILSAEVEFVNGEKKVRDTAAKLGSIIQFLPPHFTLLYGCVGFSERMCDFMQQFGDKNHLIYTDVPQPYGYDLFFNAKKNYHAVVVKFVWPAGRMVNRLASSDPIIFPDGPNTGFNGDKFQAHVTIAYIDGNQVLSIGDVEAILPSVDFFGVKVKGVSLEIDIKPKPK